MQPNPALIQDSPNLFWEFYPFTEIFLTETNFLNNIML